MSVSKIKADLPKDEYRNGLDAIAQARPDRLRPPLITNHGGITKVAPNDPKPPVRPFADVLREINHGAVADLAASQLADLVQQVSHVGRPGTMTLTIKVAPFTGGGDTLQVSAATVVKPPRNDPYTAVFFHDDRGGLSRNDPNQEPLISEKEITQP